MMRARTTVVLAAAATVVAAVPAHAATPTLDGKKTKVLTFKASSSPQDNDTNLVTDVANPGLPVSPRPDDYAKRPASRCLSWSFLYKPAKHVKRGPFTVKITWTIPGQDYDLYVLDAKYGDVGHCGASAGQGEYVLVDAPVPGHKYLVVVDEYRAAPDTVNATVSFPANTFTPAAPVPADAEGFPVACGFMAG
jgi:hypothetical protein